MGEHCCGLTRRNYLMGSAGAIAAGAFPSAAFAVGQAPAPQPAPVPGASGQSYRCPPCGLPCDQLVFDKPGTCPNCGMTLVPVTGGTAPKVLILMFNGAEIIDFAGPWEVFGAAGFMVHTVASTSEPLTMVFGQKLMPDYIFDNSPAADILLVPGGAVGQYLDNRRMIGWIQANAREVNHVMSVCTGAYLLQKAGLLVGQTVTATYGAIEDFASEDTRVVYDRRYVDNGKILTTAGLSAGIDGAFHLVSRVRGLGAAQEVALALEYPWQPDGTWARAALADRYLPAQLSRASGAIDGTEFELISTKGGSDHWETRLLFKQPATSGKVIAILRNLIAANRAIGGRTTPIAHIKGSPVFAASASQSELRWSFTDDQGRAWSGTASVAPGEQAGLTAMLKLTRRNPIEG